MSNKNNISSPKVYLDAVQIRKCLDELGVNQNDVARLCGVSRQAVSQVILGSHRSSKISSRIASLIGVDNLVIIDAKEQVELVKASERNSVKSWEPIYKPMQIPNEQETEAVPADV